MSRTADAGLVAASLVTRARDSDAVADALRNHADRVPPPLETARVAAHAVAG